MACTAGCSSVHAPDEESGCGGDSEAMHTRQFCNLMQLVRLVSDAALTPGFASSLLALKVFVSCIAVLHVRKTFAATAAFYGLSGWVASLGGFLWKLPTKVLKHWTFWSHP